MLQVLLRLADQLTEDPEWIFTGQAAMEGSSPR
jgi:hypothetical protein